MPPPAGPPNPADPWLRSRFAAYYARRPPSAPDDLARREFGYLFFAQPGMLRHVAFATRGEFERFHHERAPAHSYYSTAFYEYPAAPTMAEKGWRGAELIFDLDADHVPGSEKLPYPEQLARVKHHFVRLVDEFIRRDFGFEEKDLLLTFSGGRGYHAHVLAPKALELTSQERREIVDYITGTGLDLPLFVWGTSVGAENPAGFKRVKRTLRIAPAEAPGWGRRINGGLRAYFGRLRTLPPEALRAELREAPGIGAKDAAYIAEQLPLLTDEHIARGFVDRGPPFRKLVPHVVAQQVVALAKGETDEPVTSDTKRLIRTPGSLHGKSGLRVVPLTRDELDRFDPLTDAVAFGDEPVGMDVLKPFQTTLRGESFRLEPGRTRLPEYAAVFAAMRGAARPVDAGDGA